MKRHIILLHGALGSSNQFNELVKHIKGYNEIHTMNFMGHGGLIIPEYLTMPDLSDQLKQYIENKIPTDASLTIMGYSMGGYVALYLARERACKIDRIITLGTKLDWSPEISAKEVGRLHPDKIEEKVPLFAAELKTRHAPQDWKQLMKITAGLLSDLGTMNYLSLDRLRDIQISTKLMIGDKDNMVSLDETVAAFKTMPGASLSVLPDTTHPIEAVDVERLSFELR